MSGGAPGICDEAAPLGKRQVVDAVRGSNMSLGAELWRRSVYYALSLWRRVKCVTLMGGAAQKSRSSG